MKKLLFSRKSEELQPILRLIEKQNHQILVLWVIDCAKRILMLFEENHSDDLRPREAIKAATLLASGKIKMPVAKKAAHASHNAATDAEDDSVACAAARAIGHCVGTVHVETHAIGVVMYGLTAFVRNAVDDNIDQIVENELLWFYERLIYWQNNWENEPRQWAAFLLKEQPNKEKLLYEKTINKNK